MRFETACIPASLRWDKKSKEGRHTRRVLARLGRFNDRLIARVFHNEWTDEVLTGKSPGNGPGEPRTPSPTSRKYFSNPTCNTLSVTIRAIPGRQVASHLHAIFLWPRQSSKEKNRFQRPVGVTFQFRSGRYSAVSVMIRDEVPHINFKLFISISRPQRLWIGDWLRRRRLLKFCWLDTSVELRYCYISVLTSEELDGF